jgi:hypothetical protein
LTVEQQLPHFAITARGDFFPRRGFNRPASEAEGDGFRRPEKVRFGSGACHVDVIVPLFLFSR